MIECYLCGGICDHIVAIRGGRRVCADCAEMIDQKKPIKNTEPDFYYGYHGSYLFFEPVPVDVFENMLLDPEYSEFFGGEPIIVRLKYKYDHDTKWTEDNELMTTEIGFNNDQYIWMNDWDEGQQQKFVIGWIRLSEVNFE